MYDVIIVGGGPAGLTSAIYARRASKTVLVLEALNCGGQIINTPDIENYPVEHHISGVEFANKLKLRPLLYLELVPPYHNHRHLFQLPAG